MQPAPNMHARADRGEEVSMSAEEVGHTLFVSTPGSHLTLEGESVRCHLADSGTWRRLPLVRIESLVLFGAVTATADLLLRCADDGRPVHWLNEFGKPRASLLGPASHSGAVRSRQHAAHADTPTRNILAETIVLGKTAAMAKQLRRASHDATGHDKQALQQAVHAITELAAQVPESPRSRQQALGLEGATTRHYFTGLRHWLRPSDGIEIPTTRTRHPATDPVNTALSMAYALTRGAVLGAVHAAGLDPSIGYLHGDRDGQPALVLDLMEELRPVADHVVVTAFNRRQLRREHFHDTISGAVQLTDEGRKVLFATWHEHRQASSAHITLGREIPNALVPLVQARLLVRHLSGDISSYPPAI